MLTVALFWILLQLNAPWWCYAIIFSRLVIQILYYGIKLGKEAME